MQWHALWFVLGFFWITRAIFWKKIISTAHFEAKILHRDISVGNILFTRDGNGILIYWELCKYLSETTETRVNERTVCHFLWTSGYVEFMSVRLLEGTGTVYWVGDDLQSFAHVLACVAARYVPNFMAWIEANFSALLMPPSRTVSRRQDFYPTICQQSGTNKATQKHKIWLVLQWILVYCRI